MKVVWSERFRPQYAGDPAGREGRMDGIVNELDGWATWVEPEPAEESVLLRCHDPEHVRSVRRAGLFEIAALAAGGALKAAEIGRAEPAFALVRPPGHHASRSRAWGFCHFNNLAVALWDLRARELVDRALVLDIDLHYGDGTMNILGREDWVRIVNPGAPTRREYLTEVISAIRNFEGDWIAVSAGFDYHVDDWGGLLHAEDYELIGLEVGMRSLALRAGCFAVLEGGYNTVVLGENVREFLRGLDRGWKKGESGQADRV